MCVYDRGLICFGLGQTVGPHGARIQSSLLEKPSGQRQRVEPG
jgi:hypothetical protein